MRDPDVRRIERNCFLFACALAGLFAIGLAVMWHAAPASDARLEAALRARDQALLNALASGNRRPWERELAPDALFVDENGQVLRRSDLLSGLHGLPPHVSGSIRITAYELHRSGDLATVVHHAKELEVFYGIRLLADYVTTETWVKSGGKWQLSLVHVHVMDKDPPAVSLPAAMLGQYAGRYRLAGGPVYAIRTDGTRLVGGIAGKPPARLLAEAPDVFFTPGRPRDRKIFLRSAGVISRMVDRHEGEDLVYSRLP